MTCRTHPPKQTLLRSIAVLALSAMGVGASLADTRSVETAYGPVTVNGQPERVVTLYEGALDTTLAVDANPVGAVITRGGSDVADYIKSRAGDIAIVGAPAETNIEAVISVRPDLILAAPRTNEQQYQLLSRIAPVSAPSRSTLPIGNFQANFDTSIGPPNSPRSQRILQPICNPFRQQQ